MTEQPDDASPPRSTPAEPPTSPQPAERLEQADPAPLPEPRQVLLRRAPRYGPFVVTGVLVGLVLALGLSQLTADPQFVGRPALGYLAGILALIGGVIGAGLAVLADRPRRGSR